MEVFAHLFHYLPLYAFGLILLFRGVFLLEECDREYKEEQARRLKNSESMKDKGENHG